MEADEVFEVKSPKFEIVPLTPVIEKLEDAVQLAHGNSDKREKPPETPTNFSYKAVNHRRTVRRAKARTGRR